MKSATMETMPNPHLVPEYALVIGPGLAGRCSRGVTVRPYQLYRENYRPEQQDWLMFLQDFATLVSKYELNPAE